MVRKYSLILVLLLVFFSGCVSQTTTIEKPWIVKSSNDIVVKLYAYPPVDKINAYDNLNLIVNVEKISSSVVNGEVHIWDSYAGSGGIDIISGLFSDSDFDLENSRDEINVIKAMVTYPENVRAYI